MLKKIREFFSQKGQGVVEYALIIGFAAILALAFFKEGGLNSKVDGEVGKVGGVIEQVGTVADNAKGTISVGGGTGSSSSSSTG